MKHSQQAQQHGPYTCRTHPAARQCGLHSSGRRRTQRQAGDSSRNEHCSNAPSQADAPLLGEAQPQPQLQQPQQAPTRIKVGRMNRLLQNVNLAGTSLFFQIVAGNQGLALPHVSVPDISWVDWRALRAAGFKAAVFDKDNTLCEPFALTVAPQLAASFAACQAAFGPGAVLLYSNSAGLAQYDPQGAEADALEAAFGVRVARHADKKPAGGCTELQEQCKCQPHEMVFVGDRYLTDVVFGNRHGMLTIRVAPLTPKGEPPTVAAARVIEEACVARWSAAGMRPAVHPLLPHEAVASVLTSPPPQANHSSQNEK